MARCDRLRRTRPGPSKTKRNMRTHRWEPPLESRVGRGSFTPGPSQIPDMTVSSHPARATHRRLPPSAEPSGLLPVNRLALWARWGDPPPSLPGSYPSSSLLRGGPPLTGASVLSASRVRRLGLFPSHHRQGSHVLPGSPGWSHVPFTPDATWPVNRLLPGCSQGIPSTLVLASSLSFRRVAGDSLALISPATT